MTDREILLKLVNEVRKISQGTWPPGTHKMNDIFDAMDQAKEHLGDDYPEHIDWSTGRQYDPR